MSEPVLPGERAWRFYLDDMRAFVDAALLYTAGMTQEEFLGNRLVFDATVRNIELIGEAARNIPEQVRDSAPDIPWRQIIATRNRLIHAYLGIDDDTLWSIIRDDLPALAQQLDRLHRELSG
jgi:uncharacterized protein with HEPN domain